MSWIFTRKKAWFHLASQWIVVYMLIGPELATASIRRRTGKEGQREVPYLDGEYSVGGGGDGIIEVGVRTWLNYDAEGGTPLSVLVLSVQGPWTGKVRQETPDLNMDSMMCHTDMTYDALKNGALRRHILTQ